MGRAVGEGAIPPRGLRTLVRAVCGAWKYGTGCHQLNADALEERLLRAKLQVAACSAGRCVVRAGFADELQHELRQRERTMMDLRGVIARDDAGRGEALAQVRHWRLA